MLGIHDVCILFLCNFTTALISSTTMALYSYRALHYSNLHCQSKRSTKTLFLTLLSGCHCVKTLINCYVQVTHADFKKAKDKVMFKKKEGVPEGLYM